MSGNLDLYFTEMDRLLALDSRYKRPGFTMDVNDCAYLYTLAVYSLLMLRDLGIQVDTELELPSLMTKRIPRYLYDMVYYGDEEEEEDYTGYNYYAMQWVEKYEPYMGCLSRKNAYCELSEFMYRFFQDMRKKNNFGLWTVFTEGECMELCSTELCSTKLCPAADTPEENPIIRASAFFMESRDNTGQLRSMGIEISGETENEMSYAINNTLFINGIFVLTSPISEKVAEALENSSINDRNAQSFPEKCGGLSKLLWRPGATILADYTNNYESAATRSQIIGSDSDFEVSFDYAEISPLLPVYLYYLEKAAGELDRIYFDGNFSGEDGNGKQK